MNFRSKHIKRISLRLIALITTLMFCSTDLLWADGGHLMQSLGSRFQTNSVVGPVKEIASMNDPLATLLTLPATIANIANYQTHASQPFVLHIQDAHANEEAQRNISKILQHFIDHAGLKTIYVEGAEGKLLPEFFSFFPDKKARELVGDYFLKHARLKGPEYLALVERPAVDLIGAEKFELYEKNRSAYIRALENKERDEKALQALGEALNQISRFILSPQMRDLIRYRQSYSDEGSDLIGYVQYLIQAAGSQGLDTEKYSNLQSLLELNELELKIDFEAAKEALGSFLTYLKKDLSKAEQKDFQAMTLKFQLQRIKAKEYYAYLDKYLHSIDSKRPDFKKIKVIRDYFQYRILYDSMDVSLFTEINQIEKSLEDELLVTEEEKRIGYLYRLLDIYLKLFHFTLTKADADFYYEHAIDFKAKTFTDFLKPLYERHRVDTAVPDLSVLDQDLKNIEMFYQYALERDQVLIKSAFSSFEDNQPKIIALVTGGFHTPGIEKYIQEHGYSYAVVSPSIQKKMNLEEESKLYEDSLTQKPLALENRLMQMASRPKQASLNDPRFQLSSPSPFPSLGTIDQLLNHLRDFSWNDENVNSEATSAVSLMLLLNIVSSMLAKDETANATLINTAIDEKVPGAYAEAIRELLVQNTGYKQVEGQQTFYWIKQEGQYGVFGLVPRESMNEINSRPGFNNVENRFETAFDAEHILFYREIKADFVPQAILEKIESVKVAAPDHAAIKILQDAIVQLTALNNHLLASLPVRGTSVTNARAELSSLGDRSRSTLAAVTASIGSRSELRTPVGDDDDDDPEKTFRRAEESMGRAQSSMAATLERLSAEVDFKILMNRLLFKISDIQMEWLEKYDEIARDADALEELLDDTASEDEKIKATIRGVADLKKKLDAAWNKLKTETQKLPQEYPQRIVESPAIRENFSELYKVVGAQADEINNTIARLETIVLPKEDGVVAAELVLPVVAEEETSARDEVFNDLGASVSPSVLVANAHQQETVAQETQPQEEIKSKVSSNRSFFRAMFLGAVLVFSAIFFYSASPEDRRKFTSNPFGAIKQFFEETIPLFFQGILGSKETTQRESFDEAFQPIVEDETNLQVTESEVVTETQKTEQTAVVAESVKVIPIPANLGLDNETRERLWQGKDPLKMIDEGGGLLPVIETLEEEQLLNLGLHLSSDSLVQEAPEFKLPDSKHTILSDLSPYERTDFYALLNLAAIDQKDLRYLTEDQKAVLLKLHGTTSLRGVKYEDLTEDTKVKLKAILVKDSPLMSLARFLKLTENNPGEFYLLDLYAKMLKPIFARYNVERSEMNRFVSYLPAHMTWIDNNFKVLQSSNPNLFAWRTQFLNHLQDENVLITGIPSISDPNSYENKRVNLAIGFTLGRLNRFGTITPSPGTPEHKVLSEWYAGVLAHINAELIYGSKEATQDQRRVALELLLKSQSMMDSLMMDKTMQLQYQRVEKELALSLTQLLPQERLQGWNTSQTYLRNAEIPEGVVLTEKVKNPLSQSSEFNAVLEKTLEDLKKDNLSHDQLKDKLVELARVLQGRIDANVYELIAVEYVAFMDSRSNSSNAARSTWLKRSNDQNFEEKIKEAVVQYQTRLENQNQDAVSQISRTYMDWMLGNNRAMFARAIHEGKALRFDELLNAGSAAEFVKLSEDLKGQGSVQELFKHQIGSYLFRLLDRQKKNAMDDFIVLKDGSLQIDSPESEKNILLLIAEIYKQFETLPKVVQAEWTPLLAFHFELSQELAKLTKENAADTDIEQKQKELNAFYGYFFTRVLADLQRLDIYFTLDRIADAQNAGYYSSEDIGRFVQAQVSSLELTARMLDRRLNLEEHRDRVVLNRNTELIAGKSFSTEKGMLVVELMTRESIQHQAMQIYHKVMKKSEIGKFDPNDSRQYYFLQSWAKFIIQNHAVALSDAQSISDATQLALNDFPFDSIGEVSQYYSHLIGKLSGNELVLPAVIRDPSHLTDHAFSIYVNNIWEMIFASSQSVSEEVRKENLSYLFNQKKLVIGILEDFHGKQSMKVTVGGETLHVFEWAIKNSRELLTSLYGSAYNVPKDLSLQGYIENPEVRKIVNDSLTFALTKGMQDFDPNQLAIESQRMINSFNKLRSGDNDNIVSNSIYTRALRKVLKSHDEELLKIIETKYAYLIKKMVEGQMTDEDYNILLPEVAIKRVTGLKSLVSNPLLSYEYRETVRDILLADVRESLEPVVVDDTTTKVEAPEAELTALQKLERLSSDQQAYYLGQWSNDEKIELLANDPRVLQLHNQGPASPGVRHVNEIEYAKQYPDSYRDYLMTRSLITRFFQLHGWSENDPDFIYQLDFYVEFLNPVTTMTLTQKGLGSRDLMNYMLDQVSKRRAFYKKEGIQSDDDILPYRWHFIGKILRNRKDFMSDDFSLDEKWTRVKERWKENRTQLGFPLISFQVYMGDLIERSLYRIELNRRFDPDTYGEGMYEIKMGDLDDRQDEEKRQIDYSQNVSLRYPGWFRDNSRGKQTDEERLYERVHSQLGNQLPRTQKGSQGLMAIQTLRFHSNEVERRLSEFQQFIRKEFEPLQIRIPAKRNGARIRDMSLFERQNPTTPPRHIAPYDSMVYYHGVPAYWGSQFQEFSTDSNKFKNKDGLTSDEINAQLPRSYERAFFAYTLGNPYEWNDAYGNEFQTDIFDSEKMHRLVKTFNSVWQSGEMQKLYEKEYGKVLLDFFDSHMDGTYLKNAYIDDRKLVEVRPGYLNSLAGGLEAHMENLPEFLRAYLFFPLKEYRRDPSSPVIRAQLYAAILNTMQGFHISATLEEIGDADIMDIHEPEAIVERLKLKRTQRPLVEAIHGKLILMNADQAAILSAAVNEIHNRKLDPIVASVVDQLASEDSMQREALHFLRLYTGRTNKELPFLRITPGPEQDPQHVSFVRWWVSQHILMNHKYNLTSKETFERWNEIVQRVSLNDLRQLGLEYQNAFKDFRFIQGGSGISKTRDNKLGDLGFGVLSSIIEAVATHELGNADPEYRLEQTLKNLNIEMRRMRLVVNVLKDYTESNVFDQTYLIEDGESTRHALPVAVEILRPFYKSLFGTQVDLPAVITFDKFVNDPTLQPFVTGLLALEFDPKSDETDAQIVAKSLRTAKLIIEMTKDAPDKELQIKVRGLLAELTNDQTWNSKELDFSDREATAVQMGFMIALISDAIKKGEVFNQEPSVVYTSIIERIDSYTNIIKKHGAESIFSEVRDYSESFDRAIHQDPISITSNFLEMQDVGQGRVMAVLSDALSEGWDAWLKKKGILKKEFANFAANRELLVKTLKEIHGKLQVSRGKAWSYYDRPFTPELVAEEADVQGDVISWLLRQAEENRETERNRELLRKSQNRNELREEFKSSEGVVTAFSNQDAFDAAAEQRLRYAVLKTESHLEEEARSLDMDFRTGLLGIALATQKTDKALPQSVGENGYYILELTADDDSFEDVLADLDEKATLVLVQTSDRQRNQKAFEFSRENSRVQYIDTKGVRIESFLATFLRSDEVVERMGSVDSIVQVVTHDHRARHIKPEYLRSAKIGAAKLAKGRVVIAGGDRKFQNIPGVTNVYAKNIVELMRIALDAQRLISKSA